jgi:hypothetical protein
MGNTHLPKHATRHSCHLALPLGIGLLVVLGNMRVSADPTLEIKQITFGPKHHIFGYIGHVQTIPWNQGGRYIVALRTDFHDRMPKPEEAADIVLLDTQGKYSVQATERTRAWNLQQGTMLYWNPEAAQTQFFFNDRDPKTNKVFCVFFDISRGKNGQRVREYRFDDTPIGNSGVAQRGGYFLGINYGRLARLRPVTGYPGAFDWTEGDPHPADDGLFKVHVATGKKQLLVSYRQLAELLQRGGVAVKGKALFINHTLWNRADDRIFFFVRAEFGNPTARINVPCLVRPDGSGLSILPQHIGGHPDWDLGSRMLGRIGPAQVVYDVDAGKVVDKLGDPTIFPDPEGDIALSPDARWFVNGYRKDGKNYYVLLRRTDGKVLRTAGFDQHGQIKGDTRNDPAPCWNRDGTQVLFPSIAPDAAKTRQLFLIQVKE